MLSQFFSHSAIYIVGAVLSRGISFLLLPLYTYTLAPTDFAIVDYLTVIGALVAVTVALEIAQAIARYIPELTEDATRRRKLAATALWFTLATHGAFAIAALLTSGTIAHVLFDQAGPEAEMAIRWAGFAFLSIGLVTYFRNLLRAELRPMASSAVAIIHAGSVLTLSAFLLLPDSGKPDAADALIALALGGLTGAATGLWLSRGTLGLTFSAEALRQLLRFSAPLVISSVGVILAQFIDRIMVTELLGLEALAPYAVAGRIALIVSIIMVGFQSALSPLVYARHRLPETPAQIALLFRWFVALSLLGIIGLIIVAPWLIDLIAPPEYGSAVALMPILTLATVIAAAYIFFPGLNIAGRTGIIAMINLTAAGVNLSLNLLFIPAFGAVGAALATMISAAFGLVLMGLIAQRHYVVPVRPGPPLIAVTVSLGCAFAISSVAGDPVTRLALGFGLLSTTAAISVMTGLVTLAEIRAIMAKLLRRTSNRA